MIDTNDLRKGTKVEIDGTPYNVVDCQLVKPGKGQAFARVKVKNLLNGNVIERTYKSGEKVPTANIEEKEMQYLYENSGIYTFMDTASYEQVELPKTQIEEEAKWLIENMNVNVLLWNESPISLTLPNFSILQITYCEPGIKGDTATNATKPATLTTGATINVPLFVNQEDYIKIDTRTSTYVERVKAPKD